MKTKEAIVFKAMRNGAKLRSETFRPVLVDDGIHFLLALIPNQSPSNDLLADPIGDELGHPTGAVNVVVDFLKWFGFPEVIVRHPHAQGALAGNERVISL
jgi:hypothetical protein